MRRLMLCLVGIVGLCAGRWRPETDDPPALNADPASPTRGFAQPLWPALPAEHGPLPEGLANVTSQACGACHETTSWSGSAHAEPSPSWRAAAAATNDSPLCTSCHLPLQAQHATVVTEYNGGPLGMAVTARNPGYDSALAGEYVTCAACHVRDGAVVGPEGADAPHPTAQRSDEACSTCHQYTWPGAEDPLYDTVGEWSRSAWATQDVGCTDCHDHSLSAGTALSMLLAAPPELTRGEAVSLSLTVQNTGAGHAVPTGSPWTAMLLEVQVIVNDDFAGEAWSTRLEKTLETEPPYAVTSDTRLGPLEERTWPVEVELPHSAPDGHGYIRVQALRIGPDGTATPSHVTRVPVVVY